AQGQAQEHLHRDRVYVDGDIYTNSVESAFSLLKRGIMGTWHRISAKHLQAYLDEMTWRFNNRKNPFLFRDTMLRLIASDNLEYRGLAHQSTDRLDGCRNVAIYIEGHIIDCDFECVICRTGIFDLQYFADGPEASESGFWRIIPIQMQLWPA